MPALPWLKILLILIVLGGGFLGARAVMTWWFNPDYVLQRQMVSWADDAAAVPPDAPESSTPSYHFDQFAEDYRRNPAKVERAWLKATEGRPLPQHPQTRTEYIGMLFFMAQYGREREPNLARKRLDEISVLLGRGKATTLGEVLEMFSYHGDPCLEPLSAESPTELWFHLGHNFVLADNEGLALEVIDPFLRDGLRAEID